MSWDAEQVGADQPIEEDRELQARLTILNRFRAFRLAAEVEASHAE